MRRPYSHTEEITHRYTHGVLPAYEVTHEQRVFIPFAEVESERAQRAKQNARLYRQGLRMFRMDSARGKIVRVDMLDEKSGKAVVVGLRKRVHSVALCDLFPMGE